MGKDKLNSQLQKYAEESFHERLVLLFNTIYMMGGTPEEWKKQYCHTYIHEGGKQRVEYYSPINVFYKI